MFTKLSDKRLASISLIQPFRERLSDESVQHTRQDQTVVWVFTGILYIGVDEIIYKFVFLYVKYQRGYITFSAHKTAEFFCSFSFTVTRL